MQGTPLSTSALLRLGGAPGDDLGAVWGTLSVGNCIEEYTREGVFVARSPKETSDEDELERIITERNKRLGRFGSCLGHPGAHNHRKKQAMRTYWSA